MPTISHTNTLQQSVGIAQLWRYNRTEWGRSDILAMQDDNVIHLTPAPGDVGEGRVTLNCVFIEKRAGATAYAITGNPAIEVVDVNGRRMVAMSTDPITTTDATYTYMRPYMGIVGHTPIDTNTSLRLHLTGANAFTDGDDAQRLIIHCWYTLIT